MDKSTLFLLLPVILIVGACTVTSHLPVSSPAPSSENSLSHTEITNTESVQKTEVPLSTYTHLAPTLELNGTLGIISNQTATKSSMANTATPPSPEVIDTVVPKIPGRIYGFDGLVYGYLDPNEGLQSSVIPIQPILQNVIGPSGNAISLSFSDYSQEVAYITDQSDQIRLWIGDLNLTQLESVWVDTTNWLKYNSLNEDSVQIHWKNLDKFIILSNRSNFVLLDRTGNLSIKLSGTCNWLALSPKSGHFAVWCPVINEPQSYVVLEIDGSYWFDISLPTNYTIIQDWTLSPSGENVLFASEQRNIIIADETLNQLNTPVLYAHQPVDRPIRIMQWSQDGTKVLLYGYNQANKLCTNEENNSYPCWLIVNSSTGELLWPRAHEEVLSDGGSALSPDGRWLIGFVMKIPDRYGYIISLETNERKQIIDWILDIVIWGY